MRPLELVSLLIGLASMATRFGLFIDRYGWLKGIGLFLGILLVAIVAGGIVALVVGITFNTTGKTAGKIFTVIAWPITIVGIAYFVSIPWAFALAVFDATCMWTRYLIRNP